MKLKPLGERTAVVAAGMPDLRPDQSGVVIRQVDFHSLIGASALKRNRRSGKHDELALRGDLDLPLLRREISRTRDGFASRTGR